MIATACFNRCIVEVWSVSDASWKCIIADGTAGLTSFGWIADSRHLLTVSEFQLSATIWSLSDRSKHVIRHPKLSANDGFTSSADGKYLAVVERVDCKDYLGIYSCDDWEVVQHFVMESYDCVEIAWSPDDCAIAVRDNTLEYRILFYAVDGTLLSKYEAYQHALGLRVMSWSPSGDFVSLGSFDGHLRILNSLTWQPVADIPHDDIATQMNRYTKNAIEYQEQSGSQDAANRPQGKRILINKSLATGDHNASAGLVAASKAARATNRSRGNICVEEQTTFVIRKPPFSVLVLSPDWRCKATPRIGIQRALWSADSKYIASKNEQMPHNVWIWDTLHITLRAVLTFINPVKSFRWHIVKSKLAVVTGNNRVYLWTAQDISWIDIPSESFKALNIRWSPDSKSLLAEGSQECYRFTFRNEEGNDFEV